MAHSKELRVPFLDLEVIGNSLQIPAGLKVHKKTRMEKWLLRKAFDGMLPDEVLWRKKAEFSEGSGALDLLDMHAENTISDQKFNQVKQEAPVEIRSKQEMFYYQIFRNHFPNEKMLHNVGKWATA